MVSGILAGGDYLDKTAVRSTYFYGTAIIPSNSSVVGSPRPKLSLLPDRVSASSLARSPAYSLRKASTICNLDAHAGYMPNTNPTRIAKANATL